MRKLRIREIYVSSPYQPGNSQMLVFTLHIHLILLYCSPPKEDMEQVLNEKQQILIQHGGFLIKYAQAIFFIQCFHRKNRRLGVKKLGSQHYREHVLFVEPVVICRSQHVLIYKRKITITNVGIL